MIRAEQQEDPARWNFELTSYGIGEATAAPVAAARAVPPVSTDPGPDGDAALQEVAPIIDFDDY